MWTTLNGLCVFRRMLTAMFGMLEAPGSLFGGMMQRRGHQLAKKQITLVECGQEVSEPDSGAGWDGTGRGELSRTAAVDCGGVGVKCTCLICIS